MSGGLLQYSGLVTKTKAMHGRLLDREAYAQICEYETVEEFIAFLRESKSYAPIFASHEEISHRGQVEAVIADSLYTDYMRLYQFANGEQRKALAITFFRYEVDVLKTCLEYALKGGGDYNLGYLKLIFDNHACYDTGMAVQAKSLTELMTAVAGTEYEKLFLRLSGNHDMNYADYAFQLDVYYYKNAWRMIGKLADGNMKKVMRQILGTEIDWLNIMWMYRSKRFFYMKAADICANIIPITYRLKKPEYTRMLECESVEEFTELLAQTAYFTEKDAVAKPGDEVTAQRIMEKIYEQVCRKYPMSVAPVLKYLYDKEKEMDALTTILEGIRYQLPAREIRELTLVM